MKDIMTEDSLKKAISSFKKYVRLAKKDLNINIPLMEYKYIRKDKSTFWGELKVGFLRDSKGNLTGSIGILRDISKRKKAEQKLKYISFHDYLTSLYSRAYFEEEIKRIDTKRQLPLSIIIGDMNGLKLVNDTLGHLKGDFYLCRIAKILEECCRKEDIIARWGGDEFSVILPKTKKENAYKIIDRIKDATQKTKVGKIPLSISFGIATKEKPNQAILTIIQSAEDNMYNNKIVDKKSLASSTISALERTLWEKSQETSEHAQRVKQLAVKLGNSIGLYQDDIDELILLSSLHDIGKIAIADDILNKNGDLSKDEWEKIKKHPEIGYNICSSSSQLAFIAKAVLAHHEHWDGSGYPSGLKGENIPVTARIISIADSYDVMITGREYKKPLSKEEAINELKKFSGKQFDPKLINNFIEILKGNNNTQKQ
jgi:diguanylate cyclase (GGDEF)-like protein